MVILMHWQDLCITILQWANNFCCFHLILSNGRKFSFSTNIIGFFTSINSVIDNISQHQGSKKLSAIEGTMHLDIPSGVVSAPSCSNSSLAVVTYCN
jgi:hypothetical protein